MPWRGPPRRPARTTSTWPTAAVSSATFPRPWRRSSAGRAHRHHRRQHRAGALFGGGRAVSQGWLRLDSIDICIAPAQSAPRGVATSRACSATAASRCGSGATADGQAARLGRTATVRFARLRERRGALCDIPDLELFPARYAGVQDVEFRAALEVGSRSRPSPCWPHCAAGADPLAGRPGWLLMRPANARSLRHRAGRHGGAGQGHRWQGRTCAPRVAHRGG